MKKNKYFLRDFFKSWRKERSAFLKSLEVPWKNLPGKIERDKSAIRENSKKMGDFDENNFQEPKNLKKIYLEIQNYWTRHKTFKDASPQQLKNLLFILFPNPNEGVTNGIYDIPEQFKDFLETLIQKNRQINLKSLLKELLFYYPKDKVADRELLFSRMDKILRGLKANKQSMQKKTNILLFEADKSFHLTKESGPKKIAQSLLNINNDLSNILQSLWLKERHLSSNGIGKEIVKELCDLVQWPIQRLAEGPVKKEDELILSRFLEYLSGEAGKSPNYEALRQKAPDTLSFDSGRYPDIQPIVKALLIPFEEKQKIEESIQGAVTLFLDRHIGDPRSHPERWLSMTKEKDIFLKWKIGKTLEDFFVLLDYTAKKDSDAGRMWPYRKEFIESYWHAGYIKAAWIVLGKKAYAYGKRNKSLKEDVADYGRIKRGGRLLHSVLLYQIDNLTVSEWNYTGKARIWHKGNKSAPEFYKKEYEKKELIENPDHELSHYGVETYAWQRKMVNYITDFTGIPCPENLEKQLYGHS